MHTQDTQVYFRVCGSIWFIHTSCFRFWLVLKIFQLLLFFDLISRPHLINYKSWCKHKSCPYTCTDVITDVPWIWGLGSTRWYMCLCVSVYVHMYVYAFLSETDGQVILYTPLTFPLSCQLSLFHPISQHTPPPPTSPHHPWARLAQHTYTHTHQAAMNPNQYPDKCKKRQFRQ